MDANVELRSTVAPHFGYLLTILNSDPNLHPCGIMAD